MPKNLGTAPEVLFSSDPAHGRFPPPWTVEELDALSANQPMTAGQARGGRITLPTLVLVGAVFGRGEHESVCDA
jgi:hypothetical protein